MEILSVCKWNSLKLLIVFEILKPSFAPQFIKLKRHQDSSVRLPDHYQTIVNTPLLTCSVKCQSDPGCLSVNYEAATRACDISDKNTYHENLILTSVPGWELYNIVKGMSICL